MDISSLISSSPHNPAANPARMHEIWNLDIVTLFASLSHALQFSRTHEIFTRTTNYAGISEESSLDSWWEGGVNSKQKSDKNLRNPCTLHRSANFWELSRREALNFCERFFPLDFPRSLSISPSWQIFPVSHLSADTLWKGGGKNEQWWDLNHKNWKKQVKCQIESYSFWSVLVAPIVVMSKLCIVHISNI